MKDELTKVATELLQVVRDGAQWSAAMAKQEIPQVVEEYLRWAFWSGVLEALLGAVLLVVMVKLILWARSRTEQRYTSRSDTREAVMRESSIPVVIASVVGALLSLLALTNGLFLALKVTIAPRVYLLQELSKLL